jgi:L-malate glycosyltransferase
VISLLKRAEAGARSPEFAALPHVLLVLDQLPKELGGGERIVLKLAELLPSYGYRASILTFAAHPETKGLELSPCPVYLLPLRRTYGAHAVRAAIAFRRFLNEQQVELVQTFFESSDLWAGVVTKLGSNAKLIWSRRDMGILRSLKHRVCYRLFSGLPDAVFAVSDQVRRHCIEEDGIDPRRVFTVYSGLSLPRLEEGQNTPHSAGETIVLTVGNIRRVKGHDILIRAAVLLLPRFSNIVFRIGGGILEPRYFEELEKLVRDLGVSKHVEFIGTVTDLNRELSRADIFVLPSRSEGFSNAIVEAMAAALPVVATDVGGNAEAVQQGVTGYIVPPEDPAALSIAIARLAADPELARSMGMAARQLAGTTFTTEAMMTGITSTYRALLASTPVGTELAHSVPPNGHV